MRLPRPVSSSLWCRISTHRQPSSSYSPKDTPLPSSSAVSKDCVSFIEDNKNFCVLKFTQGTTWFQRHFTTDATTDRRWLLFCVHSVMMVFPTQLAGGRGGGGACQPRFTQSTPSTRVKSTSLPPVQLHSIWTGEGGGAVLGIVQSSKTTYFLGLCKILIQKIQKSSSHSRHVAQRRRSLTLNAHSCRSILCKKLFTTHRFSACLLYTHILWRLDICSFHKICLNIILCLCESKIFR